MYQKSSCDTKQLSPTSTLVCGQGQRGLPGKEGFGGRPGARGDVGSPGPPGERGPSGEKVENICREIAFLL